MKKLNDLIIFSEMLKGCDAYIATGSNNSAGYFEYYFAKYPHIIRRNRTSVAILQVMKPMKNWKNWQMMFTCILDWVAGMLPSYMYPQAMILFPY